ncbi:M23 family metallopeptidase [Bacteriovoracales bacterium]|nr:M23 family metallopeptidase [Bacteriovoracales bacterium]
MSDKFKNKLLAQEKKIISLKKTFINLEKSLGKNNKSFSKIEKEKNSLENSMFFLRSELDKNELLLKNKIFKTRRMFSDFILHSFEKDQDFEFLIQKEFYSSSLKKNMTEIQLNIDFNLRLKKEIKNLISKFKNYEKVQKNLMNLLVTMERERKQVKGKYNFLMRTKKKLESKYKRFGKSIKRPFYSGKLRLPLTKYFKIKYKEKGITFFYNKKGPVFSSEKGKVVYSGQLSTYGEVIIIDHGHETKTVLLGKFLSLPEKGTRVKKGQIISYLDSKNKIRKLYFEVRKMGKVQNTMRFLNKKLILSKMTTI